MPLTASAPSPVVLIANRGEIAIRVARAAFELGWRSVGVVASDEGLPRHARQVDALAVLPGRGAAAYLDIAALVAAAHEQGCTHVHPGYGFLSESAAFAQACIDAGLVFVGPSPQVLDWLGDKARARTLARQCGVPVTSGLDRATTIAEAQAFLAELGDGGALMIKALAGGGGRGMRVVESADEVAAAHARCQSEAQAAFGRADVYVEQLVRRARHIEVQVIGDGHAVSHLWERDCTIQRNHQKLVEMAPAPGLAPALRDRLLDAATRMAAQVGLQGLCTFEFLVDADQPDRFYFMEANPRVQVEHTVTEAVTGIDLVQAQLRVSQGCTLDELTLRQAAIPAPQGLAIQLRVNVERMGPDGRALPAGGVVSAYEPPSGPGVRVDAQGHVGFAPHPGFDTLLAKVIVHQRLGGLEAALRAAGRALAEFRLEGVDSNLAFLQAVLAHGDVRANRATTRWLEAHVDALLAAAPGQPRPAPSTHQELPSSAGNGMPPATPSMGDRLEQDGLIAVRAAVPGSLVELLVAVGEPVQAGQRLAVIEAMKMEFEVSAPQAGTVRALLASPGTVVADGQALIALEVDPDAQAAQQTLGTAIDPDHIRPDLAEVIQRHAVTLDAQRPDAVARRHAKGHRTARENVADFLDEGSFIEYGGLALASQRIRLKEAELISKSPADGLIAGLGTVNAAQFGEQPARCMVLAYDYTVFAGTQGITNHKKTDRMLHLALQRQLPLVLWAEGGGGRPNDEYPGVSLLDNMTFLGLARLSGLVPLVAIVHGRCFAGNASLAGCCDVIIATEETSIGMAGPAMIEGGGLGRFAPEEVGPVSMQAPNGVIDIVVADEREAVQVARQYIGYFQGRTADWTAPDQRLLRPMVPEKRTRVYDMRQVIHTLCDEGSVLELRARFAPGMVTALARLEGRPVGLIANDPRHLGGAIDAQGADKAARFMQLCDAFDIPLVSLCDTPGFMVGPDAEQTATVRHFSRMFLTAASLTVPFFTVVLRKGYGLGAQAMTAGSLLAPDFTVSWPSGEFGPMGLEGAVRLGFGKQLESIEDPTQRQQAFDQLVAAAYQRGKALNMAAHLELDDVIDPADTRHWLVRGLAAMPIPAPRQGRKRPFVDAW